MNVRAEQEAPSGVNQVTTPSGLEIYYQAGPKRLYRIRQTRDLESVGLVAADWQEVPSVSTVLGVLDKPALVWWGMKVGVEGVRTLFEGSQIPASIAPDEIHLSTDEIVELLKEHKLTVNHQRDKAADRGTNVHTALESWAVTGVIPDPRFFPENERGYVQGLVNFINDANPQVEFSELMVASLDGFAGRFDLVAEIDAQVVTKTYPKRQDVRSRVSGEWLLDLKTSKDVYPSYHLQLEAYHRALFDCGYDAPEHTGVIRVTEDGRYELVRGRADYGDFLDVLHVYNAIERIKGK